LFGKVMRLLLLGRVDALGRVEARFMPAEELGRVAGLERLALELRLMLAPEPRLMLVMPLARTPPPPRPPPPPPPRPPPRPASAASAIIVSIATDAAAKANFLKAPCFMGKAPIRCWR
jgi:hypothetical protein